MKVPLIDLIAQYRTIKSEVLREIKRVCDNQAFVLGEHVKGLEEEIAGYCKSKYAVGVGSGTDAILLSLMAAGVGPGDSVITTPYTFFATVSSITRLGARPVFIDIEPDTYNMDADALETLLKRRRRGVKAIIPVHLFGQCAEMGTVNSIARRYGLKVIEDAAQAIGAEYKGKPAGSLGDTGCFSFYPSKNLGGFGDGGMVTTNSKRLADMVRMLRVHGSNVKYYHRFVGINSRLDEIQAAVLRVKLRRLDVWGEKRIANAKRYNGLFLKAAIPQLLSTPVVRPHCRSVFNQYVIRIKMRDELRRFLAKNGIGTEIYYPVPLHLQVCFKGLGYKRGDFPVSEKAAKETLALPIYPEIRAKAQRYVVERIKTFFEGGKIWTIDRPGNASS